MASGTGLLNISTLQWDAELVQALGIAPEQLPVLNNKYESIGDVTQEYAKAWPALRYVMP